MPEPGRVHADSIAMLANSLSEVRVGPHDANDQGDPLSSVVRSLLQDHRGRFWYSGQDGRWRYDGNTLMYHDLRKAQGRDVTIMVLAANGDDNLWIS